MVVPEIAGAGRGPQEGPRRPEGDHERRSAAVRESEREGEGPIFDALFGEVFETQFPRLFRYLDRLSGDPEMAADLAQEAFSRLYRRGSMPDSPEAWLITAAMNLFRNARSTGVRRRRLLTLARARDAQSDPSPTPEQSTLAHAIRMQVRRAVDLLPERERHLLLLRAEGFSYGEIARALHLNEASVGTLLARARRAFRQSWGGCDVP